MPERKEGDWDCPECGELVFASRGECIFCKKKDTKKKQVRREGDWDCPDCGQLVFASRETCFHCEKAGKQERREGDWDCPVCGELVFASRGSCFHCDRAASGKKSGEGKRVRAAPKGTMKLQDAIKVLEKHSQAFRQAWEEYTNTHGEGWHDAGQYSDEDLVAFADYAAGAVQAALHEDSLSTPQEPTAAAKGTKRSAPASESLPSSKVPKAVAGETAGKGDAMPAAPKKVTMKKAFADEIRRLNESGGLSVPLRPGAIAVALSQLDQETGLSIFATLEEQMTDIEDPNEFVRDQAASAAETAQ